MAGADKAVMTAEANYKDNLSKGIAKSIKSVDALDKRLGRIGNTAARGVGTAAKNLAKIGLIAGGALAGGLLLAAKRAGEFDQQMRTINTIARVTDGQLGEVGKSIRDLARTTGADLADLTGGYYDVLSAGITDTADAQKVLTAATKLSIGSLSTSGEAVDLLTTAINAYGLKASDATYLTDIFAKSVEIGKVKASDIAATLANVAPIAHTAGISLEEIAASYGALTAQGLDAAEVTTQMNRAIVELIKPSKNLKELMKETGHNYAQIAREKGLHTALTILRKDADAAGIDILKLFGRIEGGKYVLQTTGSQAGLFEAALADIGDAAGTAEGQFAEAEKGFGYTMGRLKASAQDAAISLGHGPLPGLSKMADIIARLVGEHGPQLERFGNQIGKVVDAIATRLGGSDAKKAIDSLFNALDRGLSDTNIQKAIDSIGDMFGLLKSAMPALKNALSISGQVVGKMVELFNSMPDWVKTAVLTGWGLNKLTGGALGDIFGELAKGLIKGVLGINAGVVHINAATVTGAGGVPGVGAAGKGLSVAKVVMTAAAVTIAGVAVAALVEELKHFGDVVTASKTDLQTKTTQATSTAKGPTTVQNLAGGNRALEQFIGEAGKANAGNIVQGLTLQISGAGKQISSTLLQLSDAIVKQDGLSSGEIRTAIKEMETAQKHAIDLGDQRLANAIGADIGTMRQRLAATVAATGARQLSAIHGDTASTARNLDQVTAAVRNKKFHVVVRQDQKQSSVMSLRNVTGGTTQGKPGFHYTRSQGQDLDRFLASGAVGVASRPTSAIFGEAGKEAFAILRNPRKGTIGGGGTTVNVTVNIDPRRITKKQASSGIYRTYVAT